MKHYLLLCTAFTLSISAFAQTGPGGVGSSATNRLWYDANRLALANGATVSPWTDVSGNGSNATQGTITRRPIFTTNAVNGKPAVTFDGINDYLQTGAIPALNTNTLSWFTVVSAPMNQLHVVMRSKYTSGATGGSSAFWGTFINNGYIVHTRQANGAISNLSAGSDAGYSIVAGIWNNATFSAFRNGTSQGTTAVSSTPSGHNFTRIGADTYSLQYFLNGSVAEVIVYSSSVNAAQRIIIENYLSSKYAISVANDRYAFDAAHGNEVAGIGQEGAATQTDSKGSGIVQMNSASALSSGDFLLWGHDNAATTTINSEMPSGITSRMAREWRVDETGNAGTVTVSFDLTGITFGSSTGYYLLQDADGNFSDAVIPATTGTFNAVTNTVTFTGIDFADGEFFTIANADMIVSVQTGNWNTASTWNCGCIPVASNDVQISNTHTVTVDAASSVGDITIVAGGTLAFGAGINLNIAEDLDNQGTFTAGTGSVTFNGTAAQTISSTSTITFNDIILNNSNGLTLGAAANINNSLTATAGTFAAGANAVTFVSNSITTAFIGETGATGGYTGTNYIAQRFISARNANWADLSSPMQNATLNDWDQELFMSGVGGNDGNACCPVWNSVYTYAEPTATYNAVTSVATPLVPTVGYELWLATTQTTMAAATIDTRGTPTFGDRTVSVTRTGASPDPGWNLVGNPYQAFIAWDDMEMSNLDNIYYVFDNVTGSYATYGAGTSIPPTQGFYVHSSSGTPSLVIRESSKTTSNASTFLRQSEDLSAFTMTISNNVNPFSHKAKVMLDESATGAFEGTHDALFLKSPEKTAPAIYMLSSDNQKLVTNTFPAQAVNVSIPVIITAGADGVYTIDMKGIENLLQEYSCASLEDRELNKIIDLSINSNYSFELTEGTNASRFVIRLSKNGSECERLAMTGSSQSNDLQVISGNEGVFLKFNTPETGTAIVSVVNVLGQQVMADMQVEAGEQLVKLDVPSNLNGVYFIKVQLEGREIVEKIFVRARK